MIGSFQQNNVELHNLICHPSTTSVMLALHCLASRLTYHRRIQPKKQKKEMRSRVVNGVQRCSHIQLDSYLAVPWFYQQNHQK